jgi:acyl carrier protein
MDDVATDVIAIIAARARTSPPKIGLGDRLEDLGLESLDAVEMIFDLEEKFDIQIPYNANSSHIEFDTVGEIVDAIKKLVGKKS